MVADLGFQPWLIWPSTGRSHLVGVRCRCQPRRAVTPYAAGMPEGRPAIAAELKRRVLVEAGPCPAASQARLFR